MAGTWCDLRRTELRHVQAAGAQRGAAPGQRVVLADRRAGLARRAKPPQRGRERDRFFDSSGAAVVDKQPEPAFADEEFRREAKQARSVTFVAHVRYATAGAGRLQN